MESHTKQLCTLMIATVISACNFQNQKASGPVNDLKAQGFDYGRFNNGHYHNSFFELDMDLPSQWVLQSQTQTEHIMKSGEAIIAGNDQNMQAAIKEIDVASANLVTVFQYELGAAVNYNPNLMLLAENLKHAEGVKNGADYLFHSRKLLMQSALKFEHVDDSFDRILINGKEFYTMHVSLNYMGLEIKQIYYSTIQSNFSLSLILSYVTEEQKSELMKSLNSMRFKI